MLQFGMLGKPPPPPEVGYRGLKSYLQGPGGRGENAKEEYNYRTLMSPKSVARVTFPEKIPQAYLSALQSL